MRLPDSPSLHSNRVAEDGQGCCCRAIMGLPRWKRSGGRDFVFFHSHPGFEWDDLAMTTVYQETVCEDFQWATMLAVEQGQRWRCPTYSPR